MLAIVDYGAGNQTSVARALNYLGVPCQITADPDALREAPGVIFPGVGSAGQAMANLQMTGLDKALAEVVDRGQPLLGICLGCQILLERSDEENTSTLGVLRGQCRAFPREMVEEDGTRCRIPHMGWNNIQVRQPSPLLDGIGPEDEFYFVHSFYVEPPQEFVLGTTSYGLEFCSVYGRNGLWGVQFHVEKSGEPGLRMLRNFTNYCRDGGHAV